MLLVDLLRHDANHYATQTALRLDGAALAAADLARRVEATAAALGRHVRPGDRVGLWLENSFAWVASFLAVNALGAVSVPINTRLTAVETRDILRDAQASVVVTTRRYRGRNYHDELMAAASADALGLTAIVASDDHPGVPAAQGSQLDGGSPPGVGFIGAGSGGCGEQLR